jgi:acyl-CoA thioester hydrolase
MQAKVNRAIRVRSGRTFQVSHAVSKQEAVHRLRVPFRDVDMHGHVHNGAYFSYFETAITELLRNFDLMGCFSPGAGSCDYHVKKVELVYNRPIGFDKLVEVRASLDRIGRTSLTFAGRIDHDGDAEPSVTATIVWVCVDRETRRAVAIPDGTRAALAVLGSDTSSQGR